LELLWSLGFGCRSFHAVSLALGSWSLELTLRVVTVLEVIKRSTEFLEKKGVDSPRLQTELLLAHLLGLRRMQLYLNFERQLSQAEIDNLRELIKRRSRREPLQHIVGSTSFCGLELAVNRHVLIPRPETELLAEQGWIFLNQTLNAVPTAASRPRTALDLGTGSGCLAIALATHCPTAQFFATDISAEAIELARQNAARHQVVDRIHFFQGDAFAALESPVSFDLIISNPPYIASAEIPTLQAEVRDHDPHQALDGGPDGLAFYRRIAAEAAPFLKAGGKIMLEFGDGQAQSISDIFESQKWIVEAIVEDYTQRPRIIILHG
jgi:release factor glutamine methyltransferase